MAIKRAKKATTTRGIPKGHLMVRLEEVVFRNNTWQMKCCLIRFPKGRKAFKDVRFEVTLPRSVRA